jgi:hypothetical protein
MSVPGRLALFTLGLGVVFATATAAGRAVDPVHDEVADPMGEDHGAESGDGAHGPANPSPGAYRLFLQFQYEGVVRAVPVTVEVLR